MLLLTNVDGCLSAVDEAVLGSKRPNGCHAAERFAEAAVDETPLYRVDALDLRVQEVSRLQPDRSTAERTSREEAR